ncbi:MAG: helix-turn-helix transcriptional regulator [Kofleriaceae bacterium]
MPSFRSATVYLSGDLDATRCMCDGCDPRRAADEATTRASLWIVTSGAMKVRDASGVRVIDPTLAIVMPAQHPFVVTHPAGPDICLGFHGPLVEELAAHGPRLIAITPAVLARITAELGAWRDGCADELALTELLGAIASHDSEERTRTNGDCPPRADRSDALDADRHLASTVASEGRDLASAVAREIRLSFARSTSLGELAEVTGYSVFHTCRVFQRATGQTIHGFRRELRLRHALARLLDGDEPLAEIAAATGFASQSHLTNLFRARFGITPARVRTRDGQRLLAG